MDGSFELLTRLPGSWELIARATALLGLAALIIWGFRTRAASTRHTLWTTTFVVLIALPFTLLGLPTLELPILANPASVPDAAGTAPQPSTAPGSETAADLPIASVFVPVWAMGSLAGIASLGLGWTRFHAWVHKGRAIRDPEWLQVADRLRADLGIRRGVRLIASSQVHTAMVGGLIRPTVLLPTSAKHWSADRRATVLTHELMHVRHYDPLRQLIGGVALALYWFHPLSWLAARLAVATREQACDEGVLQQGTRPSDYAAHLLALASRPAGLSASLALPLAQRSQLEQRIIAILAPRRPGPNLLVASLLSTLLIVCGVATAVVEPISPIEAHARACQHPNPIPD